MAQKKEYRSAQRSRRMIRQAFLELLQEKEYAKITVTDIVTRADLNRSTFYAHYPDVSGVVEELQQEIVRQNLAVLEDLDYQDILRDPKPCLDAIAATLEANIGLYRRLGHTEQVHTHLDEYRRVIVSSFLNHATLPESLRQDPATAIRMHFFIGGIMNTYQQWAQGVLSCTLEEISGELAVMIRQSGVDYVENQPPK